MDATTTAASAIASLKNEPSPHTIRVYLVNGKLASIANTTKKRWKTKIARILASMDWEAIEPLDLNENLIGPRVENKDTGKATELEDLSEMEMDPKSAGNMMTLLHGLTKLMLKAQSVALEHQERAYTSVLDNNQKLVQVISGRLTQMENHAQQSFDTVTALHNRLALEIHNNSGEDDAGDDLDDFARDIVKAVMRDRLNGKTKETPPETGGEAE